jgi:hypothetical protein
LGGSDTFRVSDYDDIKKQTGQFGGLHQRIHETFERRSESREAWAAWEQACRDFHSYDSPMRFIETADGRTRLREGDPALVEHAIAFLELDPYVFRSGYAKAAIIRCIKRLPFTHAQLQRLQGVVLRALDKCDRQEFRAYCRLAAAVDSPAFDARIRERLDSSDAAVRRRARYILDYLDDWRRSD